MDWIQAINSAINYKEEHIYKDLDYRQWNELQNQRKSVFVLVGYKKCFSGIPYGEELAKQ